MTIHPKAEAGDNSRKHFYGALLLILALSGTAEAHDWYTGTRNPVTGTSCCGGQDCRGFPEELVRVVEGGYLVSPPGREPEFVPYDEALPSRDGLYHRCEYLSGPHKGERRCFFSPPQGF